MPADLTHSEVQQPADPTISLWRYMDLSKFVALLQQQAIVFPRADLLGDPFEGSVPLMNKLNRDALLSGQENLPDSDPLKAIPPDRFKYLIASQAAVRRAMVRSFYVSCWHMNEGESAAMWKVYSKSDEAICIRTDYATLANALPDSVTLGIVEYVDYSTFLMPEGNGLTPLLLKRRSFAHEREARALLWRPEMLSQPLVKPPAVEPVPVDLSKLIKTVYVSPECPNWFKDAVSGLVDTYGLRVPVKQSELSGDPLF